MNESKLTGQMRSVGTQSFRATDMGDGLVKVTAEMTEQKHSCGSSEGGRMRVRTERRTAHKMRKKRKLQKNSTLLVRQTRKKAAKAQHLRAIRGFSLLFPLAK